MKKEKNKFTYIWILCLILMISLFFVGGKSLLKGTYSADAKCYTYNGKSICVGAVDNTVYGKYKWNFSSFGTNASSHVGGTIGQNVNFTANNKSYKRIDYDQTYTSEKLYYNDTTYPTLDSKKRVYYRKTTFLNGFNWVFDNGWNEQNTIMHFKDSQKVSSDWYKWFVKRATPYNECYYNENANEFVWTNVAVGVLKSQYSTESLCKNARVVILNDSTGNVTIADYGTPHYHWTSKGANFNPTEIYANAYNANDKRTGYDLMWNSKSDGSGDLYNHYAGWKVDGNLKLYAIWVKKKYFVYYDANGGKFDLDYDRKTHGEDLTLTSAIPTRTGHEFVSWNIKRDGSGTSYSKGGTYKNNATVTLYAQWIEKSDDDDDLDLVPCPGPEPCVPGETYRVIFNANGGTGAPAEQPKVYNVDLTLTSAIPTRTGYNFTFWNTKTDGSGTSYSKGGTYKNNATVTLYAQWEEKTYTVTYSCNGATNCPSSQIKKHFSDLKLISTEPKREGYTFIGWSTSRNGEVKYKPANYYINNQDITLYAKWIKGDNLSRCNIRDNPPTSDKMLVSIGLMILTFIGFGYFYFIVRRVKD